MSLKNLPLNFPKPKILKKNSLPSYGQADFAFDDTGIEENFQLRAVDNVVDTGPSAVVDMVTSSNSLDRRILKILALEETTKVEDQRKCEKSIFYIFFT